LLTTLRNRNFFLLWSGGLISMMGTWMLFAALPFYVYEVTGSALATGSVLMALVAPGMLFGSVAGVFVDRWDRRRVLLAGNLVQAAIIPWLLLVDTRGWIWVVYVVIFLESTVNQFLIPAENALLPSLVDEVHLVSANSLNALNDNLARIVGAALGGILLGTVGFRNVVIIDAASYAAAAALIAFVVAPRLVGEAAALARGSRWRRVWQEWLDGLRLVTKERLLRNLFIVVGVGLFGDAILSALLAVFAQDVAGFSATDYGWVLAARGIGGILGALLIAQIGSRLSRGLMIYGGLAGTGIFVLAMVMVPTLPTVITLMIAAGPVFMAWIISTQTVMQSATAEGFRGRVFGAYGTVSTLVMFVGSGLGGSLADAAGVTSLMYAATVIYVTAGVLGWILLRGLLARPAVQAAAD
jgi:predicted MFS family arabinose efflux permease